MLDTQQHKWLQMTQLLERTKQRARKIDLNHAANLRKAKAEFGKEYDLKMDRLRKEKHTARSQTYPWQEIGIILFILLWTRAMWLNMMAASVKDCLQALETEMVKKKAAAAAQRRAEQQQRELLAAKRESEPKKPMTIQERLQELAEQDLC